MIPVFLGRALNGRTLACSSMRISILSSNQKIRMGILGDPDDVGYRDLLATWAAVPHIVMPHEHLDE